MDDESGESTDGHDVTGVERGKSELKMRLTMKGAGSRNKVKHVERKDQVFVTRMISVDEQERQPMKSECCEEAEQ